MTKPPAKKPKKSILSLLCCGTADYANTADQHELQTPATKVTKVGADRPTTASRPENVRSKQQNAVQTPTEKDALKQTDPSHDREDITSLDSGRSLQLGGSAQPGVNGELTRPGDTREQPLPELPKEASSSIPQAGQSNPAVVVQAPPRTDLNAAQDSSEGEKDGEGDVQMDDSDPLPGEKETSLPTVPRREDAVRNTLPPPPPVPQPGPSDESVGPDSVDGKQQWLLPPIAPRFKGKKCLVLDLDETLVHSSFKVCLIRWDLDQSLKMD
jgi:RNA polymerase II subunit A small phosphatase-like protein